MFVKTKREIPLGFPAFSENYCCRRRIPDDFLPYIEWLYYSTLFLYCILFYLMVK